MYRILTSVLLSTALVGTAAWAEDTSQQPCPSDQAAGQAATDQGSGMGATNSNDSQPSASDQSQSSVSGQDQSMASSDINQQQAGQSEYGQPAETTTTTAEEATRGYLSNEKVGIRPQLGVLLFTDNLSSDRSTAARAAAGLTIDMNAASAFGDIKGLYVGPSTGIIYSHLGSPSSNFFGANAPTSTAGGSNFFYIPLNLKLGYNIVDNWRVAVHGGGNLTYRSIADAMFLSSSTTGPGSIWRLYPNVGADIEANLGKNIALTIRPDLTMTPGDDFFTGTVALAIPIG